MFWACTVITVNHPTQLKWTSKKSLHRRHNDHLWHPMTSAEVELRGLWFFYAHGLGPVLQTACRKWWLGLAHYHPLTPQRCEWSLMLLWQVQELPSPHKWRSSGGCEKIKFFGVMLSDKLSGIPQDRSKNPSRRCWLKKIRLVHLTQTLMLNLYRSSIESIWQASYLYGPLTGKGE